jgi:cyanophycinase-like exopeptidase
MARVHRQLVARLPERPRAVLLETPYLFQENAAEITARALEYFAVNVGLPLTALPLGARDTNAATRAAAEARLADADLVFSGPGSPSYALERWRATGLAEALRDLLERGGTLTFASAAALTLGSHAVPVYEIYKVGEDPRWLAGLDVLGAIGLPVAVIPHYDNAEGGTHDTRFCYLGERRLAAIEPDLPAGTFVLGIDSHTALVLDLEADAGSVEGLGGVTVRVAGRSERIPAGERVSRAELLAIADRLRRGSMSPDAGPVRQARPEVDADGRSLLRDDLAALEGRLEAALSGGSSDELVAGLVAMDELIDTWHADTDQGEVAEAREAFHRAIARAVMARTDRSGARFDALIALVVELRSGARDSRDYALSDRIRESLAEAGIEVRDGPGGSTWALSDPMDRSTA